jgi:hypothetical protein
VIIIIIGGGVAIVGLLIFVFVWEGRTVAHLRVIRMPPGEAPEEIRQAWVGVELPLRRWETKSGLHTTEGVLSLHGSGKVHGYAVDGRAAVEALAAHSPEAAHWWRTFAPQVVAPGYLLLFPSEVCEGPGEFSSGPKNESKALIGLGSDGKGGVWKRDANF